MHGIIKQLVLVLKIDCLLIPWHLIKQHLNFLWFGSLCSSRFASIQTWVRERHRYPFSMYMVLVPDQCPFPLQKRGFWAIKFGSTSALKTWGTGTPELVMYVEKRSTFVNDLWFPNCCANISWENIVKTCKMSVGGNVHCLESSRKVKKLYGK